MIVLDDDYQHALYNAWQKFLRNEIADYSFIRPEILESWRISRFFSVEPVNNKRSLLSPQELKRNSKKYSLLIEVAKGHMEELYSIIRGSHIYIMLCDKNGGVLSALGDPDILKLSGPETRLVPGANWTVQQAGTNAVELCLSVKRPVQVFGAEHYVERFKRHTCSCSPINDHDGELLGCINITGLYGEINSHTLGMITNTAGNIERDIKLKRAVEEVEMLNLHKNLNVSTFEQPVGLILLDSLNRILHISKKAASLLRLDPASVLGRHIFDLVIFRVEDHAKDTDFNLIKGNIYDIRTEVTKIGSNDPPSHLSVSLYPLNDSSSNKQASVIILSPQTKKSQSTNQNNAPYTFKSIIGSSQAIRDTIFKCKQAARTSANVVLSGESGTGKELFAQSIHNASSFCNGPFIAVNCAAIPQNLVESELFGYEKGAFSGANKEGKPGKFEIAQNGTIFLDEIGDMPWDIQATLLRVLEEREIVRIGGLYPRKINVRIIAATNKNLLEEIEKKMFREDLYYRLNVCTINIPPLRERLEDINDLVAYFAKKYSEKNGNDIRISEEALITLKNYSWPGNVRELENTIEKTIILQEDGFITVKNLPDNIRAYMPHERIKQFIGYKSNVNPIENKSYNINANELNAIIKCLKDNYGHIERSANMLGINTRTLYRKIKRYNIDCSQYRKNNNLS